MIIQQIEKSAAKLKADRVDQDFATRVLQSQNPGMEHEIGLAVGRVYNPMQAEPVQVAVTDAIEQPKLGILTAQEESSLVKQLTEQEAISIVKSWAADDEHYDTSERMTAVEMIKELQEIDLTRKEYGHESSGISKNKFAEIVRTHAPNAPRLQPEIQPQLDGIPYPSELSPLITSGDVVFNKDYEHWMIRRCQECGQFNHDICCDKPTKRVSAALHDNKALTKYGRQALGIEPIVKPEPPKAADQIQTWKESNWWSQFKSVDELQGDGSISWIIQNILPEGVTVLSGLPKQGKSALAMSLVKAITSGKPWLSRPGYEVPKALPVLWLAAESGDSVLKIRCEKFRITKDKSRFIARTLTQGAISLNYPELEKLVRTMQPYIVLETLVRFGDGEDENSAKETNKLAQDIFTLISWGAKGILALHHSRKDLKLGQVDLEKAVRGSGDFAAMADCIWVLVRDENLYKKGVGPNEVEVSGWGRDFNPYPLRLGLTCKASDKEDEQVSQFAPGLVSVIDQFGDLIWVNKNAAIPTASDEELQNIVTMNPTDSVREIATKTGQSFSQVGKRLKNLGWVKGQGKSNKWACPSAS